jgi:Ca-activated chloride channel homolog
LRVGGGSSKPSEPMKDVKTRRPSSKSADAFGGALGSAEDSAASLAPPPLPTPAPEAPAVTGSEKQNVGSRPLAPRPAEEAPAIARDPDPDAAYHDWGAAIYLSNDDTMSLSSAQRVIFAIDNFLPLPAAHIRPHELLNYFSFDTKTVGQGDDFSVDASIAPDPEQAGIYSLALAVRGRPVGLDERRNANLSLVIDRSGSMSAEGRMTYLKRGLEQMTGQLKQGDMVHLVLFDHEVCTAVENFVVGRDRPAVLMQAIRSLEPRGSTDLHMGLNAGYQLADRTYQPTYGNRVVMITDAIANTGVTDEQLIATVGKYYDERRIRLSGVGVGRDFNDGLLDALTERGKGAYVFLGSEAEVDAVFGPRFISLVETTALDVHFQLHLPPSLRMNVFYGEESSTVKEDVQAIHYFANTSQLFLSDLMVRGGQTGGKLRAQDSIMLTIEYEDPDSGDEMIEEYAFNLGEVSEASKNVRKGRLIMRFIDGLQWMASRPMPGAWGSHGQSWEDGEAWEACEAGRGELAKLAEGLQDDREVQRVTGLWDQYCARYSQPREPVRRPPPEQGWPSASGG